MIRSSLRRYVKALRWTGDISRSGLASALRRARRERDRIRLNPWRAARRRRRPNLELG